MRAVFDGLTAHLRTLLQKREEFTAWFEGENSDFVRMNLGKVRQPGSVAQRSLSVDLILGQKHAGGTVTISGDADVDRLRLDQLVQRLRATIVHLPDDPFLLYHQSSEGTDLVADDRLPDAADVTERVLRRAGKHDFVGIYAGGRVFRGFASSFGQKNWFERSNFHLDFSIYLRADKAVKSGYAGETWDDDAFGERIDRAITELDVLARPAKTIDPGSYRVYLAPSALFEILEVLAWSGFGTKSHRTKQTPFLKMIAGDARLSEMVTLSENAEMSTGPRFGTSGFPKPSRIELIRAGTYHQTLCSPRSAKEYGVVTNGARDDEMPQALDFNAGNVPNAEVLERLGTGIYVNNLWYLNFSDRSAGRITGMTRFATMWVENGRVVAPLNAMRFDESIYRVLGEKLLGLTSERDFILDGNTYGRRSTACAWVPGALVSEMRFTL